VLASVTGSACDGSDKRATRPRALERFGLEQAFHAPIGERFGAVALVQTQKRIWRGASGYAAPQRRAAPENRFGIGSTTKTFVATVVLQLMGEGRLSLEDKVGRWLPGRVRGGRRITIRELLNHTSGLQDVAFALPPRNAQPPLLFQPGTAHRYTNVNYVILGLIVEKVTGRSLDLVVRQRIFRPLDLEDTSYGTAIPPRDRSTPAWLGTPMESVGPVRGAGGIVSTTADLATFFRALLRGELFEHRLLAEMTETVNTGTEFRAGLGIFQADLPCGSPWGHGGDMPSYSNQVLVSRDGSTVVVVARNTNGWSDVKAVAEEMYCSMRRGSP
jgi:D-alanyl-D-alanine carboxypeptidase